MRMPGFESRENGGTESLEPRAVSREPRGEQGNLGTRGESGGPRAERGTLGGRAESRIRKLADCSWQLGRVEKPIGRVVNQGRKEQSAER